jgi:hypothetical protein
MVFHWSADVSGYVARMGATGQAAGEGSRRDANEANAALEADRRLGHPERFSPNCSAELSEKQCNLSYLRCEFYSTCSGFS